MVSETGNRPPSGNHGPFQPPLPLIRISPPPARLPARGEDGHAIPIAEEPVIMGEGQAIGGEELFAAMKGGNHQHQGGAGLVKIGDQSIHHLEGKRRADV